MIKDLVVNLGLGKPRDVAADYAISIAAAFGAHACGVAFAYEPVVPRSGPAHGLIIEGALFGAGRPVIVVPYIHRDGLKRGRVMVCWDGSRPAARAIADAMPFLARAAAIDVVIVASGRETSDEIPG